MGELGAFYEKIPIWDSLLHTVNGFICAGVGFGRETFQSGISL